MLESHGQQLPKFSKAKYGGAPPKPTVLFCLRGMRNRMGPIMGSKTSQSRRSRQRFKRRSQLRSHVIKKRGKTLRNRSRRAERRIQEKIARWRSAIEFAYLKSLERSGNIENPENHSRLQASVFISRKAKKAKAPGMGPLVARDGEHAWAKASNKRERISFVPVDGTDCSHVAFLFDVSEARGNSMGLSSRWTFCKAGVNTKMHWYRRVVL